jgi:hypothetical protein
MLGMGGVAPIVGVGWIGDVTQRREDVSDFIMARFEHHFICHEILDSAKQTMRGGNGLERSGHACWEQELHQTMAGP